jgi:hypothetical protein
MQTEIRKGTKVVVIVIQGDGFRSRLYVNNGETATLMVKTAKTLKGAEKQANEMLSK